MKDIASAYDSRLKQINQNGFQKFKDNLLTFRAKIAGVQQTSDNMAGQLDKLFNCLDDIRANNPPETADALCIELEPIINKKIEKIIKIQSKIGGCIQMANHAEEALNNYLGAMNGVVAVMTSALASEKTQNAKYAVKSWELAKQLTGEFDSGPMKEINDSILAAEDCISDIFTMIF